MGIINNYLENKITHINKLLIVLLGVLILLVLLISIPKSQAFNAYKLNQISFTEIPTYENQFRLTIAQIIGGVLLIIGLFLTNKRIQASEKQAESSLKQVQVFKRTQEIETFTKAIEQLSSDKLFSQLGALSTLEQLAKEKETYSIELLQIIESILKVETTSSNPNKHLIDGALNLLKRIDDFKGNGFQLNLDKFNGKGIHIYIETEKDFSINISPVEKPSSLSFSIHGATVDIGYFKSYSYTYLYGNLTSNYSYHKSVGFGNTILKTVKLSFYNCFLENCNLENVSDLSLNKSILKECSISGSFETSKLLNCKAIYNCDMSEKIIDVLKTQAPHLLTKQNFDEVTSTSEAKDILDLI